MKLLKTSALVLILLFTVHNFVAQVPGDTIVVNTFNYSMTYGSGIRDTVISFPDISGVTYEKILMRYNMRCKNGSISTGSNTNLGCGEWDYSCNTYLHDSTRVDSVLFTQPSHIISGFTGTTFNYSNSPAYDYYQYSLQQVNLNNIVSESQYPLLTGSTGMPQALNASNFSGKSQFIYTAAELNTAGFTAGNIDGFLVNALNGGNVNFLKVKIKGTSATVLSAINLDLAGFTEVYFNHYSFLTGSNRIQFYTPFVWNGIDNLIVEFSFTQGSGGTAVVLEGTSSTPDLSLTANNGYYLNLAGGGHVDVPVTAMSTINNEVTVSFWAFGDANLLPANTSILEGLGSNGERELNIHLPWSDGSIYWDCGNVGGYDRINKAAAVYEYEGQWNHWAFVKNATTGVMQIYLNGTLWHSGTGKVKPIELAQFVIGKSASYTNNYKGSIDELRIWDKALTATDIQGWKNISLTNAHPQYAHLVAYYPFDEGTGNSIYDASVNTAIASATTFSIWKSTRGEDLSRFFVNTNFRPNITLLNGIYDTTITTVLSMDSIELAPNTIEEFTIVPHIGTLQNDEVLSINTQQVWAAIPQNIYDATTGLIIGTVPVSIDGSVTPTVLNYMRRYPMKFELMSFVTPYGINLNLGPNGKTWTFDMTDYMPILKGNKRITMERGGQWQEDMDIQFLFIVGTPFRDVLDIREVWRTESRSYTSIMSDQYFEPIDVPTLPTGNAFKVRTSISGHGQEGEFIPRNHFLNVNGGATEFDWQVWKGCADNPIYPQGGTWIYDRAGWCPGAPTEVEHNDITPLVTPGSVVNLDYGLITAAGASNYIVSNQLVTYGAINKTLDAAIVEVSQPSERVEFARLNSICHSPKVVLKNEGSTVLTQVKIKYWVNSASTPEIYNWTGTLASGITEEVELPSPASLWSSISSSSTNTFYAEVAEPNNGTDVYALNNRYSSTFKIPDVVPSNLIIHFRTNSFPGENYYEILDDQDNVVFSRSNMTANTLYRDTLTLPLGCFTYNVTDSDEDGISFWANNDGTGYTKFQEVAGPTVKNFLGDFGKNIHYNFTVNYPLSYEEINNLPELAVHPNPTHDELNISLRKFDSRVKISIVDNLGKMVKSTNIETEFGVYTGKIDISDLPNGLYVVVVSDENKTSHVKIIKN
ncbi:MAG: LamG-like jellyroll fold domain-containing protein [Crocinitomicaceae bacterium]